MAILHRGANDVSHDALLRLLQLILIEAQGQLSAVAQLHPLDRCLEGQHQGVHAIALSPLGLRVCRSARLVVYGGIAVTPQEDLIGDVHTRGTYLPIVIEARRGFVGT